MKYIILLLVNLALTTSCFAQDDLLKIEYSEIKDAKKKALKQIDYDPKAKDAAFVVSKIDEGTASEVFVRFDDSKTKKTAKYDKIQEHASFDLTTLEDGKEHTVHVYFNKPEKELANFKMKKKDVPDAGGQSANTESSQNEYYWDYIKENNLFINLKQFRYDRGDEGLCCDCSNCEDLNLTETNRIVYDAITGITYYFAKGVNINNVYWCANWEKNISDHKITNHKKLVLKANEPVTYIVQNINPEIYDIELTDSSFLTNNDLTKNLMSLLIDKTHNITPQGSSSEKSNEDKIKQAKYLRVKSGLILLAGEMDDLLRNLNYYSKYKNKCSDEKRIEALQAINKYVDEVLGRSEYPGITLTGLTDIFLTPADSNLRKAIFALYNKFIVSSSTVKFSFRVPEKDIWDFHLNIKSKMPALYPNLVNNTNVSKDARMPTQRAYIKNFFKVDVSSGLYYGFNMNDETYALIKDSAVGKTSLGNDTTISTWKRLKKEDISIGEFGFASYIHFYYKHNPIWALGGTIGAGISFTDPVRVRYFTGLSLMLGTHNRVCINGGAVWGFQNQISDIYTKTSATTFSNVPVTETAVTYKKDLRVSGFLSISYNIPFLKSPKAETAPPEPSAEK